MTDPAVFLDAMLDYQGNASDADNPRHTLLATVDPSYSGPPALPKVTFDGETALTSKTYNYLGQAPKPGSRVLMQAVGATSLIVGPIGGNEFIPSGVQTTPIPVLKQYSSVATGAQALTTTLTDVSGSSISFTTTTSAAIVFAIAAIDLRDGADGGGYQIVAIYLDGVEKDESPTFGNASFWPKPVTTWVGTVVAGSHTIKLRTLKQLSGGGISVEPWTRLVVLVWE